jgi:hypothetical protein
MGISGSKQEKTRFIRKFSQANPLDLRTQIATSKKMIKIVQTFAVVICLNE